jgi:hypothetical protein
MVDRRREVEQHLADLRLKRLCEMARAGRGERGLHPARAVDRRHRHEQAIELGRDLGRRGPRGRRLHHARGDQLREAGRQLDAVAALCERLGRLAAVGVDERDRRRRLEQRHAREREVRDAAERVDVGRRPDLAIARLLRRPVERRAERLLVLGEPRQAFVRGELR